MQDAAGFSTKGKWLQASALVETKNRGLKMTLKSS
jgi:hypothetical protein